MANIYTPPLVKTELPFEFYVRPNLYPSNFSTRFGTLPKRPVEIPLRPTIVHSDFARGVAEKAAELQRTFPDEIWDVKVPQNWDDLHFWFDPYDIHIMGASFLIQVLYKVFEQNQAAHVAMQSVIDEAAIEWVARNEHLVASLLPHQEVLPFVPAEELLYMKPRELAMYSIALDKHRRKLHARLLGERHCGQSVPVPLVDPMMVHGALQPHPLFVPFPGVEQRVTETTPVRPVIQTPTAERLVNGLRLSVGSQTNDTPRKDNRQRVRRFSNEPSRQGKLQPRRYSNDPTRQGKSQPRRYSNDVRYNKGQRPRGYSTISARNGMEGSHSSIQRHVSNPSESPLAYQSMREPIYVLNGQQTPSAQQSPPRQPPLFDPSIIAQGPERTPAQSPNQNQTMQQVSEHASFPSYQTPKPNTSLSSTSTSPNRISTSLQDVRVISSHVGPNSQLNRLPKSPFHNRQFSREAYKSHRIPSSASSASPHTLRPERYEYQNNGGFIHRARNYSAQQVGEIYNTGHGKIVTFNGRTKQENNDPTGRQTMFLANMSEEFFDSHAFRSMLDDCGQVCDMTYNRPKYHNVTFGVAFIHFASVEYVEIGIKKFNSYRLPDGRQMRAIHATPRAQKSGNQYPHRYNDHPSFTAANSMGSSSRRPSIHMQPQLYIPHQYSNQQSCAQSPERREPLTDGFQRQLLSATLQLEQDQNVKLSMTAPLGDVTNIQKKDAEFNFGVPMLPKKENLPVKNILETSSGSPGNETLQDNQETKNGVKQGAKKKKKKPHYGKNTANSSAQPTPSTTPTKLKSAPDLGSLVANNDSKRHYPLKMVTGEVEDNKNHRKPHAGINQRNQKTILLVSQKKQESLTTSPVSTGSTANTAFTNSFASTAPPSRQTSVVSMSSIATSEASTPKAEQLVESSVEHFDNITPTKMPAKSLKKAVSMIDLASPQPLPLESQTEDSEVTTNKLIVKKNGNRQATEPSNACTGNSKPRKKGKSHAKKESVESLGNYDSSRNSDAKNVMVLKADSPQHCVNQKTQSEKLTDKFSVLEAAATNNQINKQTLTESTLNLNYNEQFPSLEPAKSPSSTIADGKRPAAPKSLRGVPPSMGQLSQNQRTQSSQSLKNQNQSKPVVAVPRIVVPGKKPNNSDYSAFSSVDESEQEILQTPWTGMMNLQQNKCSALGSREWPFVRRFGEA